MKRTQIVLPSLWLASILAAPAASLLTPSDIIFAYDLDANDVFPGGESPAQGVDQNSTTKYLNFGGHHTGIIMTPSGGSSNVQSFALTTANDFEERDPASYLLFGTNDPITSANVGNANVNGFNENWTYIAGGGLSLPSSRFTAGSAVDVTNTSSYTSYWLVFPDRKNNGQGIMQVADISLYTGAAGTGVQVLGAGAGAVGTSWDLSFPSGEAPPNLLDGDAGTKFLSFGKENAGIWIVPSAGATTVRSFKITTGGDEPPRDPGSWRLLGQDASGVWTEIDSGALSLTDDRGAESDFIPVSNDTEYLAYRMEFDSLKDGGNANSIQFAELQFFDVIPEPSTSLLAGLGFLGLLVRRKR